MPAYVIPSVTSVIVAVGILIVILLVVWHRRFVKLCRQKREQMACLAKADQTSKDDAPNNGSEHCFGQVKEQPLNRYHNPIHSKPLLLQSDMQIKSHLTKV